MTDYASLSFQTAREASSQLDQSGRRTSTFADSGSSYISSVDGKTSSGVIGDGRENAGYQHDPEAPMGETVRDRFGRKKLGPDVALDDLVTIEGIEMTLKTALDSGLLLEGADGKFHLAEVQEQAPQELPAGEVLDGNSERTVDALSKSTQPSTQVSAVLSFIENGAVSRSVIEAAASEARIEPEKVQQMIDAAVAGFERQARAAIERYGVDPEAVAEWAASQRPSQWREAQKLQAFERSCQGYRNLARDFVENLDRIDPETVLSAELGDGITIDRAPGGNIVLNIRGKGQVTWQTALRNGWITVGSR